MADFKDKFSDKEYKIDTFSKLSASLAVAGDNRIDGRVHEFIKGVDKLPFRVKQGDQAKFFPQLKKGTGNAGIEIDKIIRDVERKIVYIPIKKVNFQNNIIGQGSHISESFSSGAYLSISASFASQFGGVDGEDLITYLVEESYTPKAEFATQKAAATVGTFNGVFNVLESGSTTQSYSAIDLTGYGGVDSKGIPDFTFDFSDSSFATHWQVRFGGGEAGDDGDTDYSASFFYPTASVRLTANNGTPYMTGAFALEDSFFLSDSSGSRIASAFELTNTNGVNTGDGYYTTYFFKAKIAGDSDSGSLYEFPGDAQVIVYPRGTPNDVVSGSFQFSTASRAAATASATFKTLYFVSKSGASSVANAEYGFFTTASLNHRDVGSPVHLDSDLRYKADVGFYSPSGSSTSSIYVQTSSRAPNGGPTFALELGE